MRLFWEKKRSFDCWRNLAEGDSIQVIRLKKKNRKNALECCPRRCQLHSAFVTFLARISSLASWIVTLIIRIKLNNNNICIRIIILITSYLKPIGKWINLRNRRCPVTSIIPILITFISWVKWYRLIKKLLSLKTVNNTKVHNFLKK